MKIDIKPAYFHLLAQFDTRPIFRHFYCVFGASVLREQLVIGSVVRDQVIDGVVVLLWLHLAARGNEEDKVK